MYLLPHLPVSSTRYSSGKVTVAPDGAGFQISLDAQSFYILGLQGLNDDPGILKWLGNTSVSSLDFTVKVYKTEEQLAGDCTLCEDPSQWPDPYNPPPAVYPTFEFSLDIEGANLSKQICFRDSVANAYYVPYKVGVEEWAYYPQGNPPGGAPKMAGGGLLDFENYPNPEVTLDGNFETIQWSVPDPYQNPGFLMASDVRSVFVKYLSVNVTRTDTSDEDEGGVDMDLDVEYSGYPTGSKYGYSGELYPLQQMDPAFRLGADATLSNLKMPVESLDIQSGSCTSWLNMTQIFGAPTPYPTPAPTPPPTPYDISAHPLIPCDTLDCCWDQTQRPEQQQNCEHLPPDDFCRTNLLCWCPAPPGWSGHVNPQPDGTCSQSAESMRRLGAVDEEEITKRIAAHTLKKLIHLNERFKASRGEAKGHQTAFLLLSRSACAFALLGIAAAFRYTRSRKWDAVALSDEEALRRDGRAARERIFEE
jgi:hypothetical protein